MGSPGDRHKKILLLNSWSLLVLCKVLLHYSRRSFTVFACSLSSNSLDILKNIFLLLSHINNVGVLNCYNLVFSF